MLNRHSCTVDMRPRISHNVAGNSEARTPWRKGASLLEFALCLPLLFILIANVVNFGGFFFAWVTVENAARTGAQYMARAGTAALGDPAPTPTTALLTTIVTNDISSLPNNPSLALRYCTRNPSNAANTSGPPAVPACSVLTGSFATTPSSPGPDARTEAVYYVMAWVDVSYTYLPFISFNFEFPALGFGPIWPGSSGGVVLHRQVIMRSIQ